MKRALKSVCLAGFETRGGGVSGGSHDPGSRRRVATFARRDLRLLSVCFRLLFRENDPC